MPDAESGLTVHLDISLLFHAYYNRGDETLCPPVRLWALSPDALRNNNILFYLALLSFSVKLSREEKFVSKNNVSTRIALAISPQ